MTPRNVASIALFLTGLFLFAGGFMVLAEGGEGLCGYATSAAVARALTAPCGGISMVAGLLMVAAASVVLWASTRLDPHRREAAGTDCG